MAESTRLPRPEGVVAIAKLFQAPNVEAMMPSYCSCNPTCSCETKPGCCEGKCGCHTDDAIVGFPGWEVLSATPAFRQAVASFEADELKTIADFAALAERISARLASGR